MEQAFNKPYPNMENKCTPTKEIEQIIKLNKLQKTLMGTTTYPQRSKN